MIRNLKVAFPELLPLFFPFSKKEGKVLNITAIAFKSFLTFYLNSSIFKKKIFIPTLRLFFFLQVETRFSLIEIELSRVSCTGFQPKWTNDWNFTLSQYFCSSSLPVKPILILIYILATQEGYSHLLAARLYVIYFIFQNQLAGHFVYFQVYESHLSAHSS